MSGQFGLDLDRSSRQLLAVVVERRAPALSPLLTGDAMLTRADVERLMVAVSDEFVNAGLGDGYEPNEYGLRLEALLDEVNRNGFV